MAFGWSLVMIQPGEAHNEMRGIFRKVLGKRAVTEFDTMIQEGARDFRKSLEGFSGDPEDKVAKYVLQTQ